MGFHCNIGCNIVAPEVDDIPGYTREIYLKRIADYRDYGFRHLEFSHLLALSPEDGIGPVGVRRMPPQSGRAAAARGLCRGPSIRNT